MTAFAQDSGAPVRVGDILAGKYRVDKVLGAGAMGVVVAAMHVELGEMRALKFMLPSMLGDAEGVERFLREARAAVRLRGQHVAKVQDVGRLENGAPYIVMEYLEGTDLKQVIDARKTLPAAEAVTYLLQACEAIAEAHAAGIVHRDLKPANLFLTRGFNGAPCIKVLDFGIAKVSSAGPGGMEMTGTTSLLGTPLYMSPEQMRSTRNVDARTDVWALGVVLYRLLAGTTPFTGDTVTEICSAVMADQPAPISAVRRDLPPGLEAVVFRCLEKNPAQRIQSIVELAAALGPFASDRAVAPAPPAALAPSSSPVVGGATAAGQTWSHGPGQASSAPALQTPYPAAPAHYAPPYGAAQAQAPATWGGDPRASSPPTWGGDPRLQSAPTSAPAGFAAAPLAPPAAPKPSSKVPIILGSLLAVVGLGAVAVAVVIPQLRAPAGTNEKTGTTATAADARPTAGTTTPTSKATPSVPAAPRSQATPANAAAAAAATSAAPPGASNVATGSACTAASQCTSGFCVDRVCCDSACTARCMACTAGKKFSGGGNGSCGWISGGEDPDHECGSGKRCDGDGSCMSMTPEQIKSLTGH